MRTPKPVQGQSRILPQNLIGKFTAAEADRYRQGLCSTLTAVEPDVYCPQGSDPASPTGDCTFHLTYGRTFPDGQA